MTYDFSSNPELAPLTDEEKRNIHTNKENVWETIMPVPDNAPEHDGQHHRYGAPTAMYEYEDSNRNLLCYTVRYEYEDDKGQQQKVVLPLTYCLNKETGKRSWWFRMPDGARPLFGLRHLKKMPNARIIVVEGEKKAKIARNICNEYVWVTSIGGAYAAEKSDWSPLAGRDVIIWRDNDKAGRAYQREVFRQLGHVCAKSVVFVDVPQDLPQGWDVADAIDDEWNAKRIERFIKRYTKQAKELPTLTMPELDTHHIPEERQYFPWLYEGHTVILFAKIGLGKTLFALGISTTLANGTDFLKWKNSLEPVGVLYIDGEMSMQDMRNRLRSFIPSMQTKAPLELLSHQEFWDTEEADMDLVEEKLQKRLKDYLINRPYIRVVVIDNLSCLFPTLREDKRDDWAAKAQPFIMWFRRHSIAVILVHHTNKQGDQSGSVAKMNMINLAIALSPLPDTNGTGQAGFSVSFPKHRSVWGDDISPIEVTLHENEDKSLRWEWCAQEASSEDRLLGLVREGVQRVKDAAEMMALTEGAVSKLKKKLVDKGLLKNTVKLALTEETIKNGDDEEDEEESEE